MDRWHLKAEHIAEIRKGAVPIKLSGGSAKRGRYKKEICI